MIHVTVELWMWLGKELGPPFESPSDMRSVLETDVEEASTVRELFEDLAKRFRAVERKVFRNRGFAPYVAMIINDRSTSAADACDRVLVDGDKVVVLPAYVGG
ncbi:MAG: hypothetical protein A2139_10980 [Desulfobacca sp. RBG_16_60_12]|nr:MAG: hypothetical protein A2139_10980 [Desulfobacca sp. RBG_16_60_12]